MVIPARHRDAELAECLRRLAPAAQTLAANAYEVIVTDDGADMTAEPMLRERFPWARWTAAAAHCAALERLLPTGPNEAGTVR